MRKIIQHLPRFGAALFVAFAGFIAPLIWPSADWGAAAWLGLSIVVLRDVMRDR